MHSGSARLTSEHGQADLAAGQRISVTAMGQKITRTRPRLPKFVVKHERIPPRQVLFFEDFGPDWESRYGYLLGESRGPSVAAGVTPPGLVGFTVMLEGLPPSFTYRARAR